MSILYNKGSNPSIVKYNGTSLDKVIYSGKVVWQRISPVSNISYSGAGHWYTTYSSVGGVFITGASGDYWGLSRSTIPSGSCISWYGSGAEVVANVDCTVTFSLTMTAVMSDGWTWYNARIYLCKNGALYTTLVNRGATGNVDTNNVLFSNLSTSASIKLAKGQRAGIYCDGGNGKPDNPIKDRVLFNGRVSISASL